MAPSYSIANSVRRAFLALAALALTSPTPNACAQELSGERVFQRRCASCHALERNRTGPALAGVLGRRAGSAPGFNYSPALRAAAFVWEEASLDLWLQNPAALAPRTRMTTRLSNAEERRAVIIYLYTQGRTR